MLTYYFGGHFSVNHIWVSTHSRTLLLLFGYTIYGLLCIRGSLGIYNKNIACALLAYRMDPARFYGRSKHVNVIPGDGSQSDDECDYGSDSEYVPPSRFQFHKKSIVIPETDSESSDEDAPAAPPPPKKKKTNQKKVKPAKINWAPEKLDDFDMNEYTFTGNSELPDNIQNLKDPGEFFQFLFNDELVQTVDQSNLKSVQDDINKPANVTKEEMEQFIGIVLFMSIVKLPAARLYWNATIGQAQVYEIMTCNRFEAIKQHLHFNDNDGFIPKGQPGHDKLFKVRPLLEGIRKQLLLVPKEEQKAVDEQIIPTKM